MQGAMHPQAVMAEFHIRWAAREHGVQEWNLLRWWHVRKDLGAACLTCSQRPTILGRGLGGGVRDTLRVSLERAHARRTCGNSAMHYVGKWKRIYDRRIGILQLSNREHELISDRYRSLGSNPVSCFFPNRDFFRFGRGSDPRLTAGKDCSADAGERLREREGESEREREKVSSRAVIARAGVPVYGTPWEPGADSDPGI